MKRNETSSERSPAMTFTNIKLQIKAAKATLGEKRIAFLKEHGATYVINHNHPDNSMCDERTHEYKTLTGALKAAYSNGWDRAELESHYNDNGERRWCHEIYLF